MPGFCAADLMPHNNAGILYNEKTEPAYPFTDIRIHQVGSTKTRHILWRTVYAKNHSPFRKYYMMRNGIYLYKKKEMPAVVLIKYIVREYLLVILYEKNKIKKLRRMNRGIWDGIKMQTEK